MQENHRRELQCVLPANYTNPDFCKATCISLKIISKVKPEEFGCLVLYFH